MATPEILRIFSRVLLQDRPGPEVRRTMAPSQRRNNPMAETREIRTAGVLLLLFEQQGIWRLPLIVRPDYDGPHSGQIAFPGGSHEPNDVTLWNTATRECEEEIGVCQDAIQQLGLLAPIFIPNSRYKVVPYIGWVQGVVEFRPEPTEVAEVLQLPLDLLLDPQHSKKETWEIRGMEVEVPFYQYGHHQIWGATAMMLCEFLYCWRILRRELAAGGS